MTFEQFLDANLEGLGRYAGVLAGDRDEAHDLLIDVLIEVQVKWPTIGAMTQPGGYVRRILTSRYIDQVRRRTRQGTQPLALLPDRPTAGGQAEVEDRDEVSRLLEVVSRRQKAALVLRYYLDLPDSAISAELGCTEATVRSLLARGLAAIRATTSLSQVCRGGRA